MSILKAMFFTALLLLSETSIAQGSMESAVGPNLPPKVRALLIQEMNAVLDATERILGALVRGQDQIVVENAQAIHDSFIMKQEMTEADRNALLNSVPDAFLERDKAFHELSASLAKAARDGNEVLQKQLFAEMIDACTGCHSEHATDRFPGFGKSD